MKKSNGIATALRQRYCPPEWALFFEVANATGGFASRRADAIAMNLWPSRGLAFHGFEIKVARYDWLREIKNPAKAEVIARYCDFWWVVTPCNLIKDGELPETWGLLEVNEQGNIRQKTAAIKTKAVPHDRAFIASLLRSAGNLGTVDIERIVDERTKQIKANWEEQVAVEVDRRTKSFAHESRLLDSCRALMGDRLNWLAEEDFARAVAAVFESGVANTWGGLNALAESLDTSAARIREAARRFHIPPQAKAGKDGPNP